MSLDAASLTASLANDFGEDFAYANGGVSRVYLNNASVSLMPKPSAEAMADFLAEYNASGPDSDLADELVTAKMKSARRIISKIISCRTEEIIFTQSTTDGINMVAGGLRTLSAGSDIIVRGMEHEHHANLYPWLRLRDRNVAVKSLGIDKMGTFGIDELSLMLGAGPDRSGADGHNARLVVLSHALYNTGAILPVAEVGAMVRRYGGNNDNNNNNHSDDRCRFFVDAAQSIGCLDAEDCDVSAIKCDYMSFNGSKWLCGPMGMGVFYCSREAGGLLDPITIGGESAELYDNGNRGSARLKFKDAPDRFQTGFRNYVGVAGLEASLRYLEGVGFGRIRSKNRNLSGLLKDALCGLGGVTTYVPDDPDARTSIVSFNVEGHAPCDVVERLQRRGIVLAVRELGDLEVVRASPHFFNTEAQMHALIDAVRRL